MAVHKKKRCYCLGYSNRKSRRK